jgi:hypothetical protein
MLAGCGGGVFVPLVHPETTVSTIKTSDLFMKCRSRDSHSGGYEELHDDYSESNIHLI